MKKIGIVLLTLCVLGLCIGVASAKPVWIDTLTLNYSADNGVTWQSVDGELAPGFTLYYANAPGEFYLLDVNEIDPVPDAGSYPFYLKTAPKGPYFKYMASRGVTADAAPGTWQAQMWKIINGQEPMFYLTCDGTTCHLNDGLLKWAGQTAPLRINQDYFVGTYHFIGDVGGARTYIKLFFANP